MKRRGKLKEPKAFNWRVRDRERERERVAVSKGGGRKKERRRERMMRGRNGRETGIKYRTFHTAESGACF